LEAAFGPLEPCSALRSVVSACLHPSLASAYHLFTTPPKRKLADWDQSLYAAGFVPAARVHLGIDRPGLTGPALRPELLAVTDLLPPTRMTEQPAHGGGAHQHGAAVATGGMAADAAGGPPVPPREGVRSPEELRQTLAAGKKPKWMKL
jgi:tether containing UBX domain for GLUT4